MPANGIITRFGLVRHAKTIWNREKRIQGQLDSPLTSEGEIHAAEWGHRLNSISWQRIFLSDSRRAMHTAERINATLKLPVLSDPRLREQNWGRWSGKTMAEATAEAVEIMPGYESAGWDFRPPGGESRRDVLDRSMDALQSAAARWLGETILVVAHEGFIKCLIYYLLKRRFLPSEPRIIKPRHLHWLSCKDQKLRIEKINGVQLNGEYAEGP